MDTVKEGRGNGIDVGIIPLGNFSKLASTVTPPKNGRFRGMAGFVRLLLQRIIKQGLRNLADIQGGPVF
jgi:hypothetical protein